MEAGATGDDGTPHADVHGQKVTSLSAKERAAVEREVTILLNRNLDYRCPEFRSVIDRGTFMLNTSKAGGVDGEDAVGKKEQRALASFRTKMCTRGPAGGCCTNQSCWDAHRVQDLRDYGEPLRNTRNSQLLDQARQALAFKRADHQM